MPFAFDDWQDTQFFLLLDENKSKPTARRKRTNELVFLLFFCITITASLGTTNKYEQIVRKSLKVSFSCSINNLFFLLFISCSFLFPSASKLWFEYSLYTQVYTELYILHIHHKIWFNICIGIITFGKLNPPNKRKWRIYFWIGVSFLSFDWNSHEK